MNLLDIFKKIGHVVGRALKFANDHGLSDELLNQAIKLVSHAQTITTNNDERRAYVLANLDKLGVPDSISRLALEMAVQEVKRAMNAGDTAGSQQAPGPNGNPALDIK